MLFRDIINIKFDVQSSKIINLQKLDILQMYLALLFINRLYMFFYYDFLLWICDDVNNIDILTINERQCYKIPERC